MWNNRILSASSDLEKTLTMVQKLDDPLARGMFLRPRLAALMTTRAPISIIHGPPGSGKSVFFEQWQSHCRSAGDLVVGFDADHLRTLDGDGFWRAVVVEAISGGWSVKDGASDPRAAFMEGLTGFPGNVVLMIDNIEDIDSFIELSLLNDVLDAHPNVRAVLVSRKPGSPRTGWVLIGPDKLFFTEDETRRFLNRRVPNVSDGSVRKMMMALSGWPGLVEVACDALVDSTSRRSFDSAIQSAVEFLVFVLRDGGEENPITDFVRSVMPATCLMYALEISDWSLAKEIITEDWIVLSAQHRSLMFKALHLIPPSVIEADPRARLVHRLLTTQRPVVDDEIPLPADRAELVAMTHGDNGHADLVHAYTSLIWFRRGGRFPDLIELCDRALVIFGTARRQVNPELNEDLSIGYLQVGLTHLLVGHFDSAERELKHSVQIATQEDFEPVIAASAGLLAMLCAFQGRTMDSVHWLEIEEKQRVSGSLTQIIRSGGKTARLLNAVESLDREAGYQAFSEIDDPTSELEIWPYIAHALCEWHRAFGDPHASLDMVYRLRRMEWHTSSAGSLAPVLLAGVEASALLSVGQAELADKAISPFDHFLTDNIKLRIQIERAEYENALRPLDFGRFGPSARVERFLLAFVAHDAMRNRTEAANALRQALTVADVAGNYRCFMFVPSRMLDSYASEVPNVSVVLEAIASSGARIADLSDNLDTGLSSREVEVVRSLAVNPTYARVAEQLFVSTSTIKTHVASIHKKWGTRKRAELLRVAASLGILD